MLAPVMERLRLLGGSLHPSVSANGRTDDPTDWSSHPGRENCRLMISRRSLGQRGESGCLAGGLFLFQHKG